MRTSNQNEIDLAVQAHAGEKELAQGSSLEVLANATPSDTSHCFITGPWELVEGSDEGNATITPPMDSPNDLEPWWTAVIICTDRDVQNRVGRLMVSAPDLLAALKNLLPRFESCCRIVGDDGAIIALATTQARAAIRKAEGGTP